MCIRDRINTTINSDGTFTYTRINNTLPGVTLELYDNVQYIKSNIVTFNSVIGLVNPLLLSPSYLIYNISTYFNIKLQIWNASYPSNVYIYLLDNINNVSYVFGQYSVTLINSIYYVQFNATISLGSLSSGSYNLYITDVDPSLGFTGSLVNQFISCLLYTSPSPRDRQKSRMPSSA